MNQYEAMFVFDPTFGAALENCEAEIRRLTDRAGAEILFLRRWDERRLAYTINGRKRGVYILVYFKSDPEKLSAFERDAQLSEHILRVLVLRAEDVTPELMEKAMPSRAADAAEGEGRGANQGDEKNKDKQTVAQGSSETPAGAKTDAKGPSEETPATETPAAEAPAAEAPATEATATETPATETSGTEAPTADTPAADNPAAETSPAESSSTESA